MITLKNINKSYGESNVLSNFTYTFQNKGFYLIFGRSGCGKTTLVNIIAGITGYDKGEYYFNHRKLAKENIQKEVQPYLAYIAQDTYFIDYLTIKENFELANVDRSVCHTYLKEFALEFVLDRYPDELSSGQKQRIAIIQAITSHKKVLILDEPTAALDKKNKTFIFDMLKKISKDTLVICVSHDLEAKQYCDHIIDFTEKQSSTILQIEEETMEMSYVHKESKNLYGYVKKLRNYKKSEKLSSILMIAILSFVLLLFMNIYDAENKLIQSLGEDYHLNYLDVKIPVEDRDQILKDLKEDKSIVSIVYTYRRGADYTKPPECTECFQESEAYIESLIYETIPIEGFYYQDFLEAGTYFTNAYEVMLGYDKALEYTGDIETLIGEQIVIPTPMGNETFTVSGVFKKFTSKETPYFENGYDGYALNDVAFFNEKYSEKYLYDDELSYEEKEPFANGDFKLYFTDFQDAMKFVTQHEACENIDDNCLYVVPISNFLNRIMDEFNGLSVFLLPCAILSLIIGMLFYGQTKIKQLYQSKHILCVYQYLGYEQKEVLKAYKKFYRIEIIRLSLISVVLSCLLGLVGNIVLSITKFPPFTIAPIMCLGIVFIFALIANLIIVLLMHQMKRIDWYEMMRERRDLL